MIQFNDPLTSSCNSCQKPSVTMLEIGHHNSFTAISLCDKCLNSLRFEVGEELLKLHYQKEEKRNERFS